MLLLSCKFDGFVTPRGALTTSAQPRLPCHDVQDSQLNQVYTLTPPTLLPLGSFTFQSSRIDRSVSVYL